MNAEAKARLKEQIDEDLLEAQAAAAKRHRGWVTGADAEGLTPNQDITIGQKATLQIVQLTMAAERAKQAPQQQGQLGVIILERRLADTPQNRMTWEAEARELETARAIEAVVVPPKESSG